MNADLRWQASYPPEDPRAAVMRAGKLWPDRAAITDLSGEADHRASARHTVGQLGDEQ
ncbi:hypothetical protein [Mycobacterium kubicae]|uniref:hypothetical protein n=1 Tax=Mycobacterium kubicae TaxID=120959 RepID=UPI000A589FC4|nr:hypothetical protein [Mycobacterium kubicae]